MLFKIVSKIRSAVMRTLLPSASYYFTGKATRSTQPLSTKYGYDRGAPIDRVYIEDFMAKSAEFIKGNCLEIVDNKYTIQFGGGKVTKSDILDIRTENKGATIYGDLKNLTGVQDNMFDCLIVTQTFGQIDEPILAAKECFRILKPNGILLATFSCLGKVEFEEFQFWRFSKASAKFVFGKAFGVENLEINTYGNSLVCQAFLAGFSAQDLTQEEIQKKRQRIPINSHFEGGKKMKKVHVIEKYFLPVTAGIEVNTFQTYSKLADRWDITFHVSEDTLTEKNILPVEENIGKIKIKRYIYSKLSYWPKINWQEVDIIALHNFNVMPHALVMLYTIWLKILRKKHYKLFLTPHGGFNPEWSIFPLPIRIAKKLYHYTVGVILINLSVDGMRAVSEWEGKEILNKHVSKKIVRVISNGIEDEAYVDNEVQASTDIKAKVQDYGRYIIQIGRVYVIKNYETVIRALPNMPKDIKFLIVGPVELNYHDNYKASLEKLAQELGVADRVLFLGVIKGIDKYYLIKKAQLMVHMAKWESFCNVVHEGMSQGLPIVCSNTYALPYLVKNGVNGFTLDVTDSKGVAEKVNYILDNMESTEITQMKQQNKEFALAHSWTKVAEKMYEFYMEKLND